MQVFKVIDAIFVIAVGIWMLYVFNKHCMDKYNVYFFTQKSLIALVISFGFILVGYDWYLDSTSNNKNIMSGAVMMILGANISLVLFFKSSSQTSFTYAIGGLLIQLIILSALAYIGSIILM